jgi:hypothetical protein
MAGLDPAIHVLIATTKKGVDARVKPGHDVERTKRRPAKAGLRNGSCQADRNQAVLE